MDLDRVYSEYEGKVVLVTGGAGCIGSNLCNKLVELGCEKIIVLDDLSASHKWNIPQASNVFFVKGSVLDDEVLKRVFREKPGFVFHLAAHFANQNSVDHPETDLLVNGMGTLKVLQYAHLTGVRRFVYTSSGCGVYGLGSKIPFEEHDICVTLHTPYQVTKLLGELYTNYFYNLYRLPIVNARLFNVYGPGEVPGRYRNVIPNFFHWAMNGKPLHITGDGNETRDWTFVDDVINGLLAMGVRDEAIGEAINLASGKEHKVVELANIVNELTGNKAGIKYVPRRNWDVKRRLLASIEKAKRLLGYEPHTSFEEGLRRVHEWFMQNWEAIRRSAEF